MKKKQIEIDVNISPDQYAQLERLTSSPAVPEGCVQDVLRYLVAAICDGVRRPGSWERGVVLQLFGDIAEGDPEPRNRQLEKLQRVSAGLDPIPSLHQQIAGATIGAKK